MSDEALEGELIETSGEAVTTLMQLNKSEYDMRISTAKRYPRSVKQFISDAKSLVTLSEEVASECMYALKRSGKTIEGPSSRFAEVVLSCWGNGQAAARVIDEDDRFVTAQGVFQDLQRNIAISVEVRRRITNRDGEKYNDDMVGVTGNAAISIALRNAVLKGIPKAFWKPIYDAARATAIGNAETLADRRIKMMDYFKKMGVTDAQIYELLEVKGLEDVTLDHVALLKGIATSIKDGEQTVDQAFSVDRTGNKVGKSSLDDKLGGGKQPKQEGQSAAKGRTKPKAEPAPGEITPEDEKREQEQGQQQRSTLKTGAMKEFLDLLPTAKTPRDWSRLRDHFLGPESDFQVKDEEKEEINRICDEEIHKLTTATGKGGQQKPLV